MDRHHRLLGEPFCPPESVGATGIPRATQDAVTIARPSAVCCLTYGRVKYKWSKATVSRRLFVAANGLTVGKSRLRRGQSGDRHAERRARHVVHADLVAERDAVGVTAVLAADPDLQVLAVLLLARLAALGHADLDQLADAVDVDRLERVDRQDLLLRRMSA